MTPALVPKDINFIALRFHYISDSIAIRFYFSQISFSSFFLLMYHCFLEFVVGSRLAPRVFFPVTPVSLHTENPALPNSNLIRLEDLHEN